MTLHILGFKVSNQRFNGHGFRQSKNIVNLSIYTLCEGEGATVLAFIFRFVSVQEKPA